MIKLISLLLCIIGIKVTLQRGRLLKSDKKSVWRDAPYKTRRSAQEANNDVLALLIMVLIAILLL